MLSQAEKRFMIHAASLGVRADNRGLMDFRPIMREQNLLYGVGASSYCQAGEAQVLCFSRALDVPDAQEIMPGGESEPGTDFIHTKIQYVPTSLAPHNKSRLSYCQAIVSLLSRNISVPKNIVLNLTLMAYGPSYCTAASIAINDCLAQLSISTKPVILVGAWKLDDYWLCDVSLAEEESSQASVLALIDHEGQVQDMFKDGSIAITSNELDAALSACCAAAGFLFSKL